MSDYTLAFTSPYHNQGTDGTDPGYAPLSTQLPTTPENPSPTDAATGVVPVGVTLGWDSAFTSTYTLKFGTSSPPSTVATGLTSASYIPTTAPGATYYWQVIAVNSNGSTAGPIWSFTTQSNAPTVPNTPSPVDGAVDIPLTPVLSWLSDNANNYDVYFGTSPDPPLVSGSQTNNTYIPGFALLNSTVYYWKIVARNGVGTATSPVWSFTTVASSVPPPTPTGIVKSHYGKFTLTTGTGTKSPVTGVVDKSGDNFIPKGFIFYSAIQDAGGSGFNSGHILYSLGFDDGTNHCGIGTDGESAFFGQQTGVSGWSAGHSIVCPFVSNITDGILILARVSAVASGQFTITVDTNLSGTDKDIYYIALGGDNLEVKVGTITPSGSNGSQSFSVTSFQPTGGLFLHLPGAISSPVFGEGNDAHINFGWADTNLNQGSSNFIVADLFPTSKASRYQSTSVACVNIDATSILRTMTVTAWNSDGFTLNKNGTAPPNWAFMLFGGEGVNTSCGSLSQLTATGQQSVPTLVDPPIAAALFSSVCNIASGSVDANAARFSFGTSDDDLNQASAAEGATGSTTSEHNARYQLEGQSISLITEGSTNTLNAQSKVFQFNGSNIVNEWSIVDTTAREVLWFVIGPGGDRAIIGGIYKIERDSLKSNDTLYTGIGSSTEDVKIPDPFAVTALLGDE